MLVVIFLFIIFISDIILLYRFSLITEYQIEIQQILKKNVNFK